MLTRKGRLLSEVLAGEEVEATQAEMERLVLDLHSMVPPRYLRANRDRSGRYRVAMVGASLGEVSK